MKGGEYMRTVFGVFDQEPYAEEAIVMLDERGYDAEDISVLMKDRAMGREVEQRTGAHVTKGAASGATTGALIGGVTGLLVGIGAIVLPGIGAFIVGGPLAAALGLSGAAATTLTGAATGAVAGGLIGALMALGLTHEEAAVYEEHIKNGALLLAIPTTEDHEEEVRSILARFNAMDITSVHVPTDRIRATSTSMEAVDEYDINDDEPVSRSQYVPAYAPIGAKGGRTSAKNHRMRRRTSKRSSLRTLR
jgi:uncharacterized membrane protein